MVACAEISIGKDPDAGARAVPPQACGIYSGPTSSARQGVHELGLPNACRFCSKGTSEVPAHESTAGAFVCSKQELGNTGNDLVEMPLDQLKALGVTRE